MRSHRAEGASLLFRCFIICAAERVKVWVILKTLMMSIGKQKSLDLKCGLSSNTIGSVL